MPSLRNSLLIPVLLAILGCAPLGQVDEPPPPGQAVEPGPGDGAAGESPDLASATGLDTGLGPDGRPIEGMPADCPPPCEFRRDAINDPSSLLATKVIYFDFDRSEIRPEFLDVIAAHGRFLSAYPDIAMRLEGHTDERGSREYNIALGERRAQSVHRLMLLQGVAKDQLGILSYGEELPADVGHDEAAWQRNRRVELIYLTP